METHKAEVKVVDSETVLALALNGKEYNIPLTKDEPNEVKNVFNSLLVALKKGLFGFSLEEQKEEDIYYYIAKEYITQLNADLEKVFDEMEDHDLIAIANSDEN